MALDVAHSPSRGLTRSIRWSEGLALATVFVAIVGMFLSSPRFAGPDENHHQGTAWYVGENVIPPRGEITGNVPGIISERPCFAFTPEADAGCVRAETGEGTSAVRILNYPPVYYWTVALGQRAVDPLGNARLDLGGRGASVLLNIGALALLAWLLSKSTRTWGSYLLLVSTPMAAFLWAVVNPSGWEITTGLVFAYLFGITWWRGLALGNGANPHVTLVGLGAASVLFGLSRHDAFVWMTLLVVAVLLMGSSQSSRIDKIRLLLTAAIGIGAGVAWNLVFRAQHVIWNETPVENPGFNDYVGWLGQIDNAMSDRIRQMIGVLGWLDTPIPEWLMFTVLAGWAMLLGVLLTRGRMPARVVIFGFAVSVFLPMAIELQRWNDWPYWYQGRITLPFTLAFLLLVLVRFGAKARRPAQAMSIVMGFALAVMVWQNLMRNAFGIRGYLPQRWESPAMDVPLYWASWVCIAALLAVTLVRIALLWTERVAQRPSNTSAA